MTERSHLNLERYVPALLTVVANKLAASASHTYRKRFGVGVVEWRMLAMLAVEDDITANRICQVTGLDKAAVSRALHQLKSTGHIRFTTDAADARRQLVSLTDSGSHLHDRIYELAIRREKALLEGLSEGDVESLIRLLRHLHGRIEFLEASNH